MKKILNVAYDFISVDFGTQEIKRLDDFRSMEIMNIMIADDDLIFELGDCVTNVSKGDVVMVVKYYDKDYHKHYEVVPLEGVTMHDMLEIAKVTHRDEEDVKKTDNESESDTPDAE